MSYTLSIVIPSYNRGGCISSLFDDVVYLSEFYKDVEIIILDNASTDEEYDQIKVKNNNENIKIIRNKFNIGMEGNICNAIVVGSGEYTWLMSDHQKIERHKFDEIISTLRNCSIDFAYVSPREWRQDYPEISSRWNELPRDLKGSFLFGVGNISTFIFRNSKSSTVLKHVYYLCHLNYPHLGVLCAIRDESIICFFNNGSSFQNTKTLSKEYCSLEASFCNHIKSLQYVDSLAPLKFSKRTFSIKYYKKALFFEVIKNICYNDEYSKTLKILTKMTLVNHPIFYPFLFSSIVICGLTPSGFRTSMFQWMLNKYRKGVSV